MGIDAIAGDYIGLVVGREVRDVVLMALRNRNEAHIREAVQRHGLQATASTDYGAMSRSGRVDAILICTPHAQYPEMTQRAPKVGLHVLVERPVGIFIDKVVEVLPVLAERPELVCDIMYNRWTAQAYHHVKSLAQSGEPEELAHCSWIVIDLCRAEVYYTSGAWYDTWQGGGGGLLMTQASHQLDPMQQIYGVPVSVLARCFTIGRLIQVKNEAELFLIYLNDAHRYFIASTHEYPGTNLLGTCGMRGWTSVRNGNEAEITRLKGDEHTFVGSCPSLLEQVSGMVECLTFDGRNNKAQQAAITQNFVAVAQEAGPTQCGLEEGLQSLQIIHGVYLSHWMGRTVTLPGDGRMSYRILSHTGALVAIGYGLL